MRPRFNVEHWTTRGQNLGEDPRVGAIVEIEWRGIALVLWLWRDHFRITAWWRPCQWCSDPICHGDPCIYSDSL